MALFAANVFPSWYEPWGKPPSTLLNGSHRFADGLLHDEAAKHGASLTHLDKQWHYAAGVRHWKPEHDHHGLSLVAPGPHPGSTTGAGASGRPSS